MKKIIFGLVAVFIATFMQAEVVEQNGQTDGYDVQIYTKSTPIVGLNDFYIVLKKDGEEISDAKVKIKVFMPEMPGMPYMEYKAKSIYKNGSYLLKVNIAMSGTWQYQFKFKTKDNVVHKIRGSINI